MGADGFGEVGLMGEEESRSEDNGLHVEGN